MDVEKPVRITKLSHGIGFTTGIFACYTGGSVERRKGVRSIYMRHIIILGIVALAPTMASADAIVRIRSDQPASAYLDGKLAGSAPLTISRLKAGSHTVKVENVQTGEVKIFNVYSPAGATAEKDIDVAFGAEAAPVVTQEAAPTSEVVQTTVVQQVPVYQQVPVVVAPQPVVYRPYRGPHAYRYDRDYLRRQQEERDKVRSRNTLLGAAAANEIFNKGSSKGVVRGVTLGGALLNEVLRSGR